MKPSDLYVSSRQFFGYFIPGSMWLGAVILITKQDMSKFFTIENDWVILAGYIVVSYTIGYVFQKFWFGLFYVLKKAWENIRGKDLGKIKKQTDRKEDSNYNQINSLLEQVVEKKEIIEKENLSKFCKWYVLENSVHLRRIIIDKEVGINFRVGIPPALFALAVGVLHCYWKWERISEIAILFAIIWAVLWAMVPKKRKEEREDWCEMFFLLRKSKTKKDN